MLLVDPKPEFFQRDIWLVALGEAYPKGRELADDHYCVVLQSNGLNKKYQSVVVAPLVKPGHWSKIDPKFAVLLQPTPENNLDQPRYMDISQIRSVSVGRLIKKNGFLSVEDFRRAGLAFLVTFDEVFAGLE
jgi:mRNA-degrading endonuclease toxin of MazEF toxin-antitoxin module